MSAWPRLMRLLPHDVPVSNPESNAGLRILIANIGGADRITLHSNEWITPTGVATQPTPQGEEVVAADPVPEPVTSSEPPGEEVAAMLPVPNIVTFFAPQGEEGALEVPIVHSVGHTWSIGWRMGSNADGGPVPEGNWLSEMTPETFSQVLDCIDEEAPFKFVGQGEDEKELAVHGYIPLFIPYRDAQGEKLLQALIAFGYFNK